MKIISTVSRTWLILSISMFLILTLSYVYAAIYGENGIITSPSVNQEFTNQINISFGTATGNTYRAYVCPKNIDPVGLTGASLDSFFTIHNSDCTLAFSGIATSSEKIVSLSGLTIGEYNLHIVDGCLLDIVPPVITLIGAPVINVLLSGSYADSGATWSDNVDGSGVLVASGSVNTSLTGSYILSYTYTDVAGNTGSTVTRTVNVILGNAPVITLLGTSPIDQPYGIVYVDSGSTASDFEDGDITPRINTSNPVNVNLVGSYQITYNATDLQGNNALQVIRTVNIVDRDPPVIILVGAENMNIYAGDSYMDSGATWIDNVDGSGVLVANGSVNTTLTGSYVLSYMYTDVAGNTNTRNRTVNVLPVLDTIPPIVTLSGLVDMSVTQFDLFVDPGATWTDNVDGSGLIPIATSGSVNTAVLGVYHLDYLYTDMSGNNGNTVTRYIRVNGATM